MDAEKFGAFIAAARKEKNMTQKALAEKLHVTDKAVSRWERGLGFPDIHTIEPLAEALGVSLLELLHAERETAAPDAGADRAAADAVGFFKAAYGRRLHRPDYEKAVLRAIQVIAVIFMLGCVFIRNQMHMRVPLWYAVAGGAVLVPLVISYVVLRRSGIIKGKHCPPTGPDRACGRRQNRGSGCIENMRGFPREHAGGIQIRRDPFAHGRQIPAEPPPGAHDMGDAGRAHRPRAVRL